MPGSILRVFLTTMVKFSDEVYLQIGFIFCSLLLSQLIYVFVKRTFSLLSKSIKFVAKISRLRTLFLFSWLAAIGTLYPGYTTYISNESSMIALLSLIIGSLFLMRLVRSLAPQVVKTPLNILIGTAALLLLTGFFKPLLYLLDHTSLKLGVINTSLLKLFHSVGLISLLTWIALAVSNRFDKKIIQNKQLSKSTHILLSKIFRVSTVTISIFFGMSLVGLDLSIITFFAGAIGVAVGFGLQNILSNIFCGIIILLDRSVRPGDVFTLPDIAHPDGGTYGVVHKLKARYVSIRTREGIEHLIPNETFVNKKTESWTHSDPFIRISIPFQVGINADLDHVEKLLLEAANTTTRVIKKPESYIRVTALNSHSIDISLRVWIQDPENGISGIKSSVYKQALLLFREHHIEIPHPPMHLYFKNYNLPNLKEDEATLINR